MGFRGSDRLDTTSDTGARVFLYPDDPKGTYRSWRNQVYLALLAIFLVLPWIEIGGYQSIWINLADRHFVFFGYSFWGHDTPLIFFILSFLAIGLALVTAVWGRLWCGWACPQTVFIDLIFRGIDRFVEGNYLKQRKLASSPLSAEKIRKRTLRWFLYSIVTLFLANTFLAYFVGSKNLLQMVQSSPFENWTAFLSMFVFNLIVLLDFGWFREQFCIIMCPYGRFQSVLMDSRSLAVLYDEERGESRGKLKDPSRGDCIDCKRCVHVCPTGIDIRDGLQMECIACTACIDACDEIMEKIDQPKGLIRYSTERGDRTLWQRFFRFRPLLYSTVLVVLLVGLSVFLSAREPVEYSILRVAGTPYEVLDKRFIVNNFKIHAQNQTLRSTNLTVEALQAPQGVSLISPFTPAEVGAGGTFKGPLTVRFPFSLQRGYELTFVVKCNGVECGGRKTIKLLGPTK